MIPCIAALGVWLDKRSSKRQESNKEFNSLLMWGVESIGELTAANTTAIKTGSAGEDTESALAEYHRFHAANKKFKDKQVAASL